MCDGGSLKGEGLGRRDEKGSTARDEKEGNPFEESVF